MIVIILDEIEFDEQLNALIEKIENEDSLCLIGTPITRSLFRIFEDKKVYTFDENLPYYKPKLGVSDKLKIISDLPDIEILEKVKEWIPNCSYNRKSLIGGSNTDTMKLLKTKDTRAFVDKELLKNLIQPEALKDFEMFKNFKYKRGSTVIKVKFRNEEVVPHDILETRDEEGFVNIEQESEMYNEVLQKYVIPDVNICDKIMCVENSLKTDLCLTTKEDSINVMDLRENTLDRILSDNDLIERLKTEIFFNDKKLYILVKIGTKIKQELNSILGIPKSCIIEI